MAESMGYYAVGEAGGLSGMLKQSIDFEGHVTTYAYDEFGRLATKSYFESVADQSANNPARTIGYTYDAFGRTVEIDDDGHGITSHTYDIEGRLTQTTSPEGVLNHAYDVFGRLERAWTSSDSAGLNKRTETAYGYDELGRMTSAAATWRNSVDIADETTAYHYDAAGRLGEGGIRTNVEAIHRILDLALLLL